jgi:hypothetical protein
MYRAAPASESKNLSSGALMVLAFPGAHSDQHNGEGYCVHPEHDAHTCKWDQKTAEGRTDDTGQVHLDSAQGDCGRELLLSHDLRYRG